MRLIVVLVCLLFGWSEARAISVSPLSIAMETTGRLSSSALRVTNTVDRPLVVELEVSRLVDGPDGGMDFVLDEDDMLFVFPPLAQLPPGASQVFRLQWLGDPAAVEEFFYVTARELPTPFEGTSEGDTVSAGLTIAIAMRVAAIVSPPGGRAELVADATELGEPEEAGNPTVRVTIENVGTRFARLGQHRLFLGDASGRQVEWGSDAWERDPRLARTLILADRRRTVTLPLPDATWQEPLQIEFR